MIFSVLNKVYRKPANVLLTLVISCITFALIVWLPNIPLVFTIVTSSSIPFGSKVQVLFSLLGAIKTNATILSACMTTVTSILFGIYVGMMAYFLKHKIKEVAQSGNATGVIGLIAGVVGVGCTACGSFLFTSFSLVGASGILAFLPLGGGEFGIIGIILLVFAIYQLSKKIHNPLVCSSNL